MGAVNGGAINGGDQKIVNELQNKIERMQDINNRRVGDINRLRQCIERLKCDLHVLFLSKKLNNKDNNQNDMLDDSTSMGAGANAT